MILCIYFTFYLFHRFLCLAPSLGRWSWRCSLSCGFWVHRFFVLLPLLVSFAFLLFSSSVSFHLPDSSAAVHPSLPSVSPFSLVLFLLLLLLSSLYSFSSLPYPVSLPVAPVTYFPSVSPYTFSYFFPSLSLLAITSFPPFGFFLCSSCCLFWLVGFGRRFVFSFVCLFFRPLFLFGCRLLYFLWFLLCFLWVFSAPVFFCCHPLSLQFLSLLLRCLCLRFLIPQLLSHLFMAFLWLWGGQRWVPQILILVNFPGVPGTSFLSLISFRFGIATFFFYDWQVSPAFGESGLSPAFMRLFPSWYFIASCPSVL